MPAVLQQLTKELRKLPYTAAHVYRGVKFLLSDEPDSRVGLPALLQPWEYGVLSAVWTKYPGGEMRVAELRRRGGRNIIAALRGAQAKNLNPWALSSTFTVAAFTFHMKDVEPFKNLYQSFSRGRSPSLEAVGSAMEVILSSYTEPTPDITADRVRRLQRTLAGEHCSAQMRILVTQATHLLESLEPLPAQEMAFFFRAYECAPWKISSVPENCLLFGTRPIAAPAIDALQEGDVALTNALLDAVDKDEEGEDLIDIVGEDGEIIGKMRPVIPLTEAQLVAAFLPKKIERDEVAHEDAVGEVQMPPEVRDIDGAFDQNHQEGDLLPENDPAVGESEDDDDGEEDVAQVPGTEKMVLHSKKKTIIMPIRPDRRY
ncbi:hypothetical protein QAD02_024250 [Eretmocerus hayati]|uniref:Uncharacterized protein n=1 Tax=Eretmocerus hayati TaxID=131215 RepID=A0ACC2Q319_9HYME|nr:hypothetical protein QAD02_024250 [Eretmocerus hayati]